MLSFINEKIKPRLQCSVKLSSLEFDISIRNLEADGLFEKEVPLYWYMFNLISPVISHIVENSDIADRVDKLIARYSAYNLSDYLYAGKLDVKTMGLVLSKEFINQEIDKVIAEKRKEDSDDKRARPASRSEIYNSLDIEALSSDVAINYATMLVSLATINREDVTKYLDAVEELLAQESERRYEYLNSRVSFKQVSFNVEDSNEQVYEMPIMAGITMIVGKSGSGKSTLVDHICKEIKIKDQCRKFYFGEPDALSASTIEVEKLLAKTKDHKVVVIIDSITNLLNASGSQVAGSGGISLELMDDLPILNSTLIKLNRSLVIVLNTSEKSNYNELIQAFSGKVSSIISASGESGGMFTYLFSSRFKDDRSTKTLVLPTSTINNNNKNSEDDNALDNKVGKHAALVQGDLDSNNFTSVDNFLSKYLT